MSTTTLQLSFVSYWHCGSGHGDGPGADALTYRSAEGLPAVPGRTIKGVLRHAYRQAVAAGAVGADALAPAADAASEHSDQAEQHGCSPSEILLFGTPLADGDSDDRVRRLEEARFQTRAGQLTFSSASLGDTPEARRQWRTWATRPESAPALQHMWTTISSTAIDERGVARDRTLRTIELALPVDLHAELGLLDTRVLEPGVAFGLVRAALPFVRAIGSQRHRGLGRVRATLLEAH